MASFDEDFEWQQRFRGHFSEIARDAMRAMTSVAVAPAEEDWKRNTDFVLSTSLPVGNREIRISARARRHTYARRYGEEFTVRLSRPSGIETEMPKVRAGYGDITIYGFESEPGSDRLGPWFAGNVALLRQYIGEGGYYRRQNNRDGSSTFGAFHLDDMPLGFVAIEHGRPEPDKSRVWERCRNCWWGKDRGGYCYPLDDNLQPGPGYWRQCLACGFRWRAGWPMGETRPRSTA